MDSIIEYIDIVPRHILEYFDTFLSDGIKNNKYLLSDEEVKNRSYTKNGKQTTNIIDILDKDIYKSIVEGFILPNIHKLLGDYTIEGVDFDYLHLIQYSKGGEQEKHKHNTQDDYSFILYLNDNDGCTIFYPSGESPRIIFPKRGKIVMFQSHIAHEAVNSSMEKRIIVGSIRERGKIWNPRR